MIFIQLFDAFKEKYKSHSRQNETENDENHFDVSLINHGIGWTLKDIREINKNINLLIRRKYF